MAPVADNPDAFYPQLGQRLRERRKRRGITQEEVASFLHLNRTTVINIEKGRQRLAVHQLAQLADHLGCTPNDLIPTLVSERSLPEGVRRNVPDDRALSFLSEIAAVSERRAG